MKIIVTIICIVAIAMVTPHRVRRDDNDVEKKLVDANNQFTAKMCSEVVKENPEKSVVLSAFSVLTTLAQLELAAVEQSQDELARAIGVPEKDIKEVFSFVDQTLGSVQGVKLKTASKIYIPPGYELNENFASVSRDVFQSEPKNVNFTKNEETAKETNGWDGTPQQRLLIASHRYRQTIRRVQSRCSVNGGVRFFHWIGNGWVEGQTNKRIKDLVNPNSLSSDTRAVLVNAIYFKGSWLHPFEKKKTVVRDFHLTINNVIKIPTMFRQGHYMYADNKDLDAQIIEIPYKKSDASFIILLPNKIDGIVALEEKLKDPAVLDNATAELSSYNVSLYLPRFKIETTTDLKQVLKKIDVKNIFKSSEARLNNLLKGQSDLYISAATQKAFIEVNEEGAEAAVANSMYLLSDLVKIF